MASITESLVKLQKLTQTNLDILKTINDSFFTKANHLSVNVLGNQYAIPSFISLENKINTLMANFENLVSSPDSGEAFFTFDGNSRAIQVRSYTSTPNSLTLKPVSEFGVEQNDIFKDFLTPCPYIKLGVASLPNDTVEVLVKKVIPLHSDLRQLFKSTLTSKDEKIKYPSIEYAYKDLYKILSNYKQDVDYIEYDTRYDMPIRKNIGTGLYVIDTIVKDEIDENLDNYITIKLRNDILDKSYQNTLSYRLFDETIERPLKVGDQLVTFEGNAKMEITEIRPNSNTLIVKVLNGEYLNLVPSTTNNVGEISSLSKIKFFSPIDFDEDKYVNVPLEEDQYVFVSIAALNSRMNVQSAWGVGLMVDSYSLLHNNETFETYYKNNVRNVGDVLFEITSMMSNTLMKYSNQEFEGFTSLEPVINTSDILVTQINKHLNDSVAVQNIRSLYSQKNEYKAKLDEIQTQINDINTNLASISFDDTTGTRAVYTSQLSNLASQRNEINTAINKILNEIAKAANDSEVPIENAKYRVRGFFDYKEFLKSQNMSHLDSHIMGMKVQYRYKNVDREQGNAMSINDKFIFSDWNDMHSFDRKRIVKFEDGYKFEMEANNDNINEPSFNQIDIPISQGETVDIRLKLVYDFGYPFVHTSSTWSKIVNIKFPEEYLKDVQILDILDENNDEIESNRFSNIIEEKGIQLHVDDKITDQDITYYHKPENISSGFYTPERRVIPLKDKLVSIDASLAELFDEIKGASGESLVVSIKNGDTINTLYPYQVNNIAVVPYSELKEDENITDGNYVKENGVATTVLNISLLNDSEHTVKLFSMFPGGRDIDLYSLTHSKFTKDNYCKDKEKGVWIKHPSHKPDCGHKDEETLKSLQSGNQFLTFRLNNPYTGEMYYTDEENFNAGGDKLSMQGGQISFAGDDGNIAEDENRKNGAYMYPKLSDRYSMSLDSNTVGDHLVIGPHEEIIIPIVFEYYIKDDSGDAVINKTMSFEIWPSLYKDPISYTFKVTAKYSASSQDKVIASNKKKFSSWITKNNNIIYKTIFK